jgi:SAM-dependent methyltransferase
MKKKLKLHLGCGTVYLDGYVNIDMQGVSARMRPDMLRHNKTTIDNYYKHPFRSNTGNVCYDIKADITDLSMYEDSVVDEILSVNVIEHIEKNEMITAAEQHWHRVLKPNGLLIISVPEIAHTCDKTIKFCNDFKKFEDCLNWIYCHGRTKYDVHRWGYTSEYLNYLLKPAGFEFYKKDNDYINCDAGYPYFVNFYKAIK